MPTSGIWALEWLNQNSQRRYPLADDATGVDRTGTFALPNDFLVELDLPVHAGLDVNPARFFIKTIAAYASGYSLTVGYQPAAGPALDVATALIPAATHSLNASYTLGGIASADGTYDYTDTVGKVTIGKLENLAAQPSGVFQFDWLATRLDPDCIRPIIRGVSAIVVVSGNSRSQRLTGDIELVAGRNVQITPSTVNGVHYLRLDAIQGEGLNGTCVCEGQDTGPCIKRIDGIGPTPAGDWSLLGDNCLKPEGIANGIQIKDACSQPCCGCQELEKITRDLELFGEKYTTLQNFLVRLEGSVTQMDAVVLGTKLNDRCCASASGQETTG